MLGPALATAIVAARATVHQNFPLAVIASELRNARTRLDALSADVAAADIRAVFACSYRLLSTDARRLFRLLPVTGGPDASHDLIRVYAVELSTAWDGVTSEGPSDYGTAMTWFAAERHALSAAVGQTTASGWLAPWETPDLTGMPCCSSS